MAGEPVAVVRQLFDAFDNLDFDAVLALAASDVQGVDELARQWLRTRDDLENYFRMLGTALSDVRSELGDVNEIVHGEVAIVTAWLEQDYTFQGEPVHVSAPTTVVVRREGGDWKVALVHSVPLADEDG